MKTVVAALLLGMPLIAFSAGWTYYVLNDRGEWEQVSPYELDLSMPSESTKDDKRIMIVYGTRDQKERPKQNWIRQVSSDLAKQIQ